MGCLKLHLLRAYKSATRNSAIDVDECWMPTERDGCKWEMQHKEYASRKEKKRKIPEYVYFNSKNYEMNSVLDSFESVHSLRMVLHEVAPICYTHCRPLSVERAIRLAGAATVPMNMNNDEWNMERQRWIWLNDDFLSDFKRNHFFSLRQISWDLLYYGGRSERLRTDKRFKLLYNNVQSKRIDVGPALRMYIDIRRYSSYRKSNKVPKYLRNEATGKSAGLRKFLESDDLVFGSETQRTPTAPSALSTCHTRVWDTLLTPPICISEWNWHFFSI